MKKLITLLLFIPVVGFSQSAILQFYHGSNQMLGAEYYFLLKNTENTYLGAGFSGAMNKNKAIGEWRTGAIQESERQLQYSTTREQWCSLYATGSLGYIGKVFVAYRGGIALYDEKANFNGENPVTREKLLYNKNNRTFIEPLIGAVAQYQITKDYGLCAGWDNFNGVTIGISVIFE